jgi:hypothetical protein
VVQEECNPKADDQTIAALLIDLPIKHEVGINCCGVAVPRFGGLGWLFDKSGEGYVKPRVTGSCPP